MEDKVYDITGKEIEVGDIVVRAKFSSQVFHKVLGITGKNIVLSCDRQQTRWSSTPVIRDGICIEDVQNHFGRTYYAKNWANRGLIIIQKYDTKSIKNKENDS